jgi:hypothetical protein
MQPPPCGAGSQGLLLDIQFYKLLLPCSALFLTSPLMRSAAKFHQICKRRFFRSSVFPPLLHETAFTTESLISSLRGRMTLALHLLDIDDLLQTKKRMA